MKKPVFFLVSVLVIMAAAFSAGCMSGDDTVPESTATPVATESVEAVELSDNITIGEMTEFMSSAVEFAKTAGKDEALVVFGKKDGKFSSGDIYVYAYDYNGTLLVHPYQPELVGTDRSDWTDARGFPFYKASEYVAENGGGFVAYLYPKPAGGSIDEAAKGDYVPKIGCIMPVDSGWWIGSGIYLSDLVDAETGKMPAATSEMITLVGSGVSYALENGNEAAFQAISDKKGAFVDEEGHYLYAYNFNGTLLAHPHLIDKIGENLMDHEGAFGEKDIRMLVSAAADGGGYVVFSWPNPENDNKPEIKIGYVLPVDDEWWLGSGVYLSEITGADEALSA